jgi:hypothetical protein
MLVPLIVIARWVALVVAIWAARHRDPRIHAPAILILFTEGVSLWLAFGILWDPRVYIVGGSGLMWMIGGPFLALSPILEAVAVAPLLALSSVAVAVAAGFVVWRLLWRRNAKQLSTVVAASVGMITAIAALEIGMEATMRIDAARIPNSCGLWRTKVVDMITNGGSTYARGRHGELRDGATTYAWSFHNGGWIPWSECAPHDSLGCSCRD